MYVLQNGLSAHGYCVKKISIRLNRQAKHLFLMKYNDHPKSAMVMRMQHHAHQP